MFIILWDVKEPAHLSKRVGHVVPDVVVCLLCCIMVGRINARRYELYQATLKIRGNIKIYDMMMIRRAVEANTEKLIKDYCCLFELSSKRAVVVISRRTTRNCS